MSVVTHPGPSEEKYANGKSVDEKLIPEVPPLSFEVIIDQKPDQPVDSENQLPNQPVDSEDQQPDQPIDNEDQQRDNSEAQLDDQPVCDNGQKQQEANGESKSKAPRKVNMREIAMLCNISLRFYVLSKSDYLLSMS